MSKRRNSSSSAKRSKAKKKGSYPDGDPEWDHLEERFSSLNVDFNRLAELVGRDQEDGEGES